MPQPALQATHRSFQDVRQRRQHGQVGLELSIAFTVPDNRVQC